MKTVLRKSLNLKECTLRKFPLKQREGGKTNQPLYITQLRFAAAACEGRSGYSICHKISPSERISFDWLAVYRLRL